MHAADQPLPRRPIRSHRLQQQPGRPMNWRQQQQGSTEFQPPMAARPAANQCGDGSTVRQIG